MIPTPSQLGGQLGGQIGRGMGGIGLAGMGMGQSPCVLVNRLPETGVTCDMIFNLFSIYGDIMRVKILYNKRSTALIQF